MDVNKYVAEKIKYYRNSKNITQDELAEMQVLHINLFQDMKLAIGRLIMSYYSSYLKYLMFLSTTSFLL